MYSCTIETNQLRLHDELDRKNIADFTMMGGRNLLIDSIWNSEDGPTLLLAIAIDSTSTTNASFIASEILFYREQPNYPTETDCPHLATIYATAFRDRLARFDNTWGIPGLGDSETTRNIIELGDPAVNEFKKLLNDTTPLRYAGGQEATMGNGYKYQTRDIACYFICRIKGWEYYQSYDRAERDSAIVELKKKL
jgi:hypothetical protein